MGSSSMKVQHYSRGFWDNNNHQTHESQPMTLGCKRFRPLAPKVTSANDVVHTNFTIDLKTFIRPESATRKLVMPSSDQRRDSISHQVESQAGGTRWNPTQEQIGILEMLYKQGMRTPNAEQIERITEQLSKYGKIEGKNVFYWFQNHKARERQRQKRNILGLPHNPRTPHLVNTSITLTLDSSTKTEIEELQMSSPYKRKFRSWTFDCSVENPKNEFSNEEDKTLELFPLHPEGLTR